MNLLEHLKNNENILAHNKLLKFVILCLSIVVMFSFYQIVSLSNNQKTILIPLGLSNKVEAGNTYIDEEYLNAMGVYISTLLYSTSPASVKTQYKILTGLFTNEAYNKHAEMLLKTASTHSKNMVSLSMKINRITVKTSPNQIISLNITVDKYIFGTKNEQSSTFNIHIGYEIHNGKFYINSLTEEKNEKQ